MKIYALYLFHYGLMGLNNRKVVSECILSIIDYWDAFNTYAWGTLVWMMTIESMSRAIQKKSMMKFQKYIHHI